MVILPPERNSSEAQPFWLVTDGYHASRSFRDIMIITSLATSDKGVTKKEIATKAAIYTICYGSGFTLVYDYLIK